MSFLKNLKPWTPLNLSGCTLFLDASMGITVADGRVSAWKDQSTNGITFAQSTTTLRPPYTANLQNGRPGADFDGGNDVLSATSLPQFFSSTEGSAFAVFTTPASASGMTAAGPPSSNTGATAIFHPVYNSSASCHVEFTGSSGGYYAEWTTKLSNSTSYIFSHRFHPTEASCNSYKNNTACDDLTYTGSSIGNLPTTLYMGHDDDVGDYEDVHLFCTIFFNRRLADDEFSKVRTWLNTRYAVY